MASNMRLNAFIWNRISQGYSQVVKDDPPQEQWQAWRRGHRELEPSAYRTPPLTPIRELSTCPQEEVPSEILDDDEERGYPRNDVDYSAETLVAAAAAVATSSKLGNAAAPIVRCATINDDADDMCYDDALSSTVAVGPLHLQEWSLPFLMPEQSGEAVKVASTSGTECLRSRLVSFRFDAPEDMQLTVVRCTFSRMEDVDDDFSTHVTLSQLSCFNLKPMAETKLEVAYAPKRSST